MVGWLDSWMVDEFYALATSEVKYQDGNRLVTVHAHCDIIVLHH